jgi:crotonobetainyl-CoA:carnitine CoA-transferase CaiB-like acyl-CoA transferase
VVKHERTWGGAAFYNIYETSDGRHIVLGGQEEKFVQALLGALHRLDLAPLCARGPGPHQKPVIDFLAGAFASMSQAEAVALLSGLDLCWSPLHTLAEALQNPHLMERGAVTRDDDNRRHIASPIRFANQPANVDFHIPSLNEHGLLASPSEREPS